MNQTTPKSSGINYAKLRKQKYKEQTIPKSMSNNLKFDIHTNHGILKQRSTSQHNINDTQQIQLFEQYFNQSKTHIQFIDFVTKQLQYHTSPIQVNANIFKNCQKKWEDEKRKILCDLNQFKEENCLLQSEIHELKRQKIALSKQCENLQTAIVQEKLGKLHRHPVYHHKFQELTKNIHIPTQETISSLTDERFESNETSLDSSLSNDEDQQLYPQFFGKYRYQFSKKLN